MIYSLLVMSNPANGQSAATAAQFARAVLERGHSIARIFFLDDGVYNAAANTVMPQDEHSVMCDWQWLATQHNVELVICVSSALRRGMLDTSEATRHEKLASSIDPLFVISGLGQLIEAAQQSDRMVTFGE
tara:strand:- start:17412 stop:17804 length:393 start_codon:yes stop_codon:yes gene_type:complete